MNDLAILVASLLLVTAANGLVVLTAANSGSRALQRIGDQLDQLIAASTQLVDQVSDIAPEVAQLERQAWAAAEHIANLSTTADRIDARLFGEDAGEGQHTRTELVPLIKWPPEWGGGRS